MAKFTNWSPKETEILKEYYPKEGGKGIQPRLPEKSLQQIYEYAQYLGIKCRKPRTIHPNTLKALRVAKRYSEHETSAVIAFYPDEGGSMCKKIPPRTKDSVYKKAHSLGIRSNKRRRWTDEEKERLVTLIQAYGAQAACKELKRSYCSILNYCSRHHISAATGEVSVSTSHHWTDDEIVVLQVLYPTKGADFCAEALNLTLRQVKSKWYSLSKNQDTKKVAI